MFFRQIHNHPTRRDRSAARDHRLNDPIKENLKRMKVNAQITALTSFLEFVGTFTYIIHMKIATSTNFATLIHFQAIYMILVPHAFLKNTSDNKNRIIDQGWNNVFKNIIGRPTNSVEPINNNSSHNKINETPLVLSRQRKKSNNQNNEVFTISKFRSSGPSNKISIDTLRLHIPFHDAPSCSKTREPKNKDHSEVGTPNAPNNTRDDFIMNHSLCKKFCNKDDSLEEDDFHTLDVNTLAQQNKKHAIAQKLISGMVECILQEEMYIGYFQKLVVFEHCCREGKILSEIDLQREFSYNGHDCSQKVITKNQKCKVNQSFPKSTNPQSNDEYQSNTKQDTINNSIQDKSRLEGELINRSLLRREILGKLRHYRLRDELYDTLIDEIIDLEEIIAESKPQ